MEVGNPTFIGDDEAEGGSEGWSSLSLLPPPSPCFTAAPDRRAVSLGLISSHQQGVQVTYLSPQNFTAAFVRQPIYISESRSGESCPPCIYSGGGGINVPVPKGWGCGCHQAAAPEELTPPPWSYVICSICSPCRQHRSQRDLRLLLPGCQLHYPHGSRERLIPSDPPHGLAQWLRIQLLHLLQCIHTHAELQQIVGLGCSQLTVGLGHSPRQLISVGAALGSVAVGLILHSPLCPIHLCLRAAGAL